jgi:transposase-like protein
MKNKIETRTRKVKQSYRRFPDNVKKEILEKIQNRPNGKSINDAIQEQGIANSLYYKWKESLLRNGMVPESFRSRHQEGRINSRYTNEEKKNIINIIENLPNGVTKKEMFHKLGVNKPDYYGWRQKFGITKVYNSKADITPMTKPMNVKTNGKILHTVTLSVEVGSLMELIGFCNEIVKTPKVKSVLSVE